MEFLHGYKFLKIPLWGSELYVMNGIKQRPMAMVPGVEDAHELGATGAVDLLDRYAPSIALVQPLRA